MAVAIDRRLLRRDGVESNSSPWIPAFGEDDELV